MNWTKNWNDEDIRLSAMQMIVRNECVKDLRDQKLQAMLCKR
jgi:hypothetical protein